MKNNGDFSENLYSWLGTCAWKGRGGGWARERKKQKEGQMKIVGKKITRKSKGE